MSDYLTHTFRFIHMGLNLRNATDKVGEGQWIVLENVEPTQEGSLRTRAGRVLFVDTADSGPVHSLKHYSATELLVGIDTALYRNTTLLDNSFSTNPHPIISFLPPVGSREWFYVADSSQMRKVTSNAATTTQKWGIVAPTVAATAALSASAGALDSTVHNASTYDWRYTFYNSLNGAESNPSPIGTGFATPSPPDGVDVTVTVPSADAQVDQIRLYRRGGVNDVGRTVWRLVSTTAQGAGPTQVILDDLADSAILANVALETDNYVPFQSVNTSGTAVTVNLPYAWGPFLGRYILACGDTFRPGDLYWTNADRPDSADIANHVSITPPGEPLIGGVIYNGQPFAFTTDNIYAIDYGGANALPTFSGRKTPCGRGAVSPWSFCVGPMIYFVNASGIYQTTGFSEAESITEESLRPLFEEQTGGAGQPISLDATDAPKVRLAYGDNRLHFFYESQTANTRHHYVYHVLYKRWHRETTSAFNDKAVMGYFDENQAKPRMYLGGEGDKVYYQDRDVTQDDGQDISCQATTGALDMGIFGSLKEFGNVIVDADGDAATTLTVKLLDVDGSQLTSNASIPGTLRAKIPYSLTDLFKYSASVDLTWVGSVLTVFGMDILWRPDKPEITHWNFMPTSHGLSGWQHIRDAYITLRSDGTTTLTVICDGATKTYSIATTSGAKSKVYVPLDPRKGKVWQWKIDVNSATKFRLYGEDCEIRVKPWNSVLGYQLLSPFGTSS